MTSRSPISPFPQRVHPKPLESVRSFMHRLQEENGATYFNWVSASIGINNVATALNSKQLDRAATMSRVSVEQLSSMQETNANRRPVLLGHRVTLPMVERTVSRLCLPCFRSDPYHRLTWDFSPITVCPIHGCTLISCCPTCSAPLHWRRNALAVCANDEEHDLLDRDLDRHLSFADQSSLDGVRALQDALTGQSDSPRLKRIRIALDLPLIELAAMLEVLGRLSISQGIKARLGTKERYGAGDYHLALQNGYEIACNWPNGFHTVLDKLAVEFGARSFLGDNSLLWRKRLHIHLTHNSAKAYCKTISRELWRYAESAGAILMPGAFGFTAENFHDKYIPSFKVRDRARIDMGKLQKIAKERNWFNADKILRSQRATWLKRDEVEEWLKTRKEQVSLTRAGERLGLRWTTVVAFVEAGLFGDGARNRIPSIEHRQRHLYEEEYLDFIERLNKIPSRGAGVRETTWNAFAKLPEAQLIGFAELVGGLLEGRIRLGRLKTSDLSSIRFDRDDALRVARAKAKTPTINGEIISLRAAVRRYRVCWYRFQRAIDLGLLKLARPKFGATEHWLSTASIDAFLKVYTTATRLAFEHSKSSVSLSALLTHSDVPEVQPHRGKYRNLAIYARRDLEDFGLESLLNKAKRESGSCRAQLSEQ